MDGTPKLDRKTLAVLLALALFFQPPFYLGSSAFAQDFEDDEYSNLLPPESFEPPPRGSPPVGGPGNFGSPLGSPSGAGNGGSASGKNQDNPLTQQKREMLAKSGIEDITGKNFSEVIESFDFPNADITDVIKAISELTGKNFIIDPGISGKITIIAPTKITVAEAYKAFLSALAIRGLAVVPGDGFYKIRQASAARLDSIDIYSGNYYPKADQFITRIIHLKHLSVDKVKRDLPNLNSKDGVINHYLDTNSLIITDYGSNIDRIQRIINALDVPGFEEQIEVVPVKYAKSKDIAELVNKIVNRGENRNQNQGGFVSGIPRPSRGAQGSAGNAFFMVIPDDRTNSLIVSGNKAGIERIQKLLKQLDFRIKPEYQGGFFVYNVRYGDAEKIAQTLQNVIKDSTPKSTNPNPSPIISPISGYQNQVNEVFGGEVKVTSDKATNSLVVVASKPDYDTILNLLSKIDSPRDQVFVEAVIMEMRASDSFDWKVGAFQFDKSGSGAKAGFNTFDGGSLADLLSPANGQGVILPIGGNSEKVTINPPNGGAAYTIPSLLGFINFLKSNTNANILSTPQILALDNQDAMIEVGDKVITGSKTTTSTNGQSSEEPIVTDATILLKIKPFISHEAQTIRMEIKGQVQQISTVSSPPALEGKVQPIATRKVETNIVVPNNRTVVLGGLMKDDDLEIIRKVPLLGDIPLLGWLFKSRRTQRVKTNMLIFLTPKIIRNTMDQQELLTKKIDQRIDYIKKVGGVDPYGETVTEIQKLNSGASALAPQNTSDNKQNPEGSMDSGSSGALE